MSIFIRPDVQSQMASEASDAATRRFWTRIERIAFRFLVAYFGLFAVGLATQFVAAPRAMAGALRGTVVGWVGHHVLRLGGGPNSFGRPWAVAQQLTAIAIAASVAAIWSALARREEYDRFAGWCRIALRYYVGVMMLIYGGFKVIPSQFPPISLDQLAQPLGNYTPMGLLWAYMGFSRPYEIFAGLGESIGGCLLFFRRTTTMGALLLIAVMSNVALINYAYDVPVKQLSTNLLLGAAALAAADLRRLVSFFVLNAPTAPTTLAFSISPALSRVRRIAKPVVVTLAIVAPMLFAYFIQHSAGVKSPLYGIYDVSAFTRNGVDVPADVAQEGRWRRVVFSHAGTGSIRLMSDSIVTLDAPIDTVAHRITLRRRGVGADFSVLSYERRGDTLSLHGTVGPDSVRLSLLRLDERTLFRLAGE